MTNLERLRALDEEDLTALLLAIVDCARAIPELPAERTLIETISTFFTVHDLANQVESPVI